MKECTLIGCGPSSLQILQKPELAIGSVAVVNRAGMYWEGRLDYWFSMDVRSMRGRIRERERNKLSIGSTRVICHRRWDGSGWEVIKPSWGNRGSSAMYAVEMLQRFGYGRCYLYGVDLIGEHYEQFRENWPAPEDIEIELINRNF